MWRFRTAICLKCLPQISQARGLAPVCRDMCSWRLALQLNFFLHSEHSNSLIPTVRMWHNRYLIQLNFHIYITTIHYYKTVRCPGFSIWQYNNQQQHPINKSHLDHNLHREVSYTYEGRSKSFLFRYEGLKLDIWNFAHILITYGYVHSCYARVHISMISPWPSNYLEK